MNQPFILHLYFQTLFLVMITYFLSYRDRSFNMRTRLRLHIVLLCAVLLVGADFVTDYMSVGSLQWAVVSGISRNVLCPMLILLWISLIWQGRNRWIFSAMLVACGANFCMYVASFWKGFYYQMDENHMWQRGKLFFIPFLICILYLIIFVLVNGIQRMSDDMLEYMVVVSIAAVTGCAGCFERRMMSGHLMDGVLVTGICVYYYYLGMQTYKRDALTKLLNRHNFNYDLEDLQDKECLISIIDIDNFKMINDKYGHSVGDRVLVKVVRVIKANLPKRCRLYRYGGDEFAIISMGVSRELLLLMFERINKTLGEMNYRVSFGIADHYPERDIASSVNEADSLMYRNKRALKSDAIWDDMTGLYNLRGFIDELELLKKEAWSREKNICLLALDVEQINNINLAYGYLEGNLIVTTIAEIIKSSLEAGEFAGHLGSDDFIMAFILEQEGDAYPEEYKKKLESAVKNSPAFDGKEYTIGINLISHVVRVDQTTSMEKVVNETLSLKQEAKVVRRKASPYYDKFEDKDFSKDEELLALDIINNNKLKYALQPIVSAKDGKVVAYEALMRSDTEPALSPLSLLRYATKNEMNYEIERLTFFNVLERLATDPDIPSDVKIFVNSIPGFTLNEEDYALLLQRYPEWMKRIVIEITEQSELDEDALTLIKNRQEKDGFKIAIDDFGSGNSNTYTLLRYRPDFIKLDRLLITDIDRNTKKQYFVNSIITFAKENGMLVLAEGVETEAELKMMIRLKVDYIQGYFTARPNITPLKEIPEDIRHTIVNETIRGVVDGKKKIFTASSGGEISLVQLALDEYTGITVTTPNLKITGSIDYVADMCIKIKDGLDCRLTMKDVRLNSVDDLPCIDVGEGASLTILLEGNCSLNNKGIHVPEGASLLVHGGGNLMISTKAHDCYGIGCTSDESLGNIHFNHSGKISIRVDGEKCAAIGGGKYCSGQGITVSSGGLDISVAGVEAVGVGSFYGDVPIRLTDFSVNVEFRVNSGSVLGSLHGMQNVELVNYALNVVGSGSCLSGIGSNFAHGGFVRMTSGSLEVAMSGQEINLLGVKAGKLSVSVDHSRMQLKGEGDKVMAIGSWDQQSLIQLRESLLDIVINASTPKVFGATEDSVINIGPKPALAINEAKNR